MEAIQIDTALLQRINQLSSVQKESILKLIDAFIAEDIDDNVYSKDIETANAEIENGYFIMHEDVVQMINGSK